MTKLPMTPLCNRGSREDTGRPAEDYEDYPGDEPSVAALKSPVFFPGHWMPLAFGGHDRFEPNGMAMSRAVFSRRSRSPG
jgi:hypothetical protein